MRGRKPRPLEIVPHISDPPRDRSESVTALVSNPTGSDPPRRRCGGADPATGHPDPVRSIHHLEDLPSLREFGLARSPGTAPTGRATGPDFPLQRAQIVRLACLEPIAKGLHITHWTSRDLARQAVEDGIVPAISDRTIRDILHHVDLQPHRTRYWRTSRIDAQFKARAKKILWCYTNAERLARRGFWVVCADEKPNFQVLEQHPSRPSIPGSIRSASSIIRGMARSTSWSS